MGDRLDPEIVRRAEDAAQKPDFAAVLDRGRTLSRRRMATATAATVVVVAGLVGATQLPDRQEAAPVVPVVPSPTQTATPTMTPPPPPPTMPTPPPTMPVVTKSPVKREPLTARQIVDDPASHIQGVQVVPGDHDKRVVLWALCRTINCRYAVASTIDGFQTRTVPDVVWSYVTEVRIADNGDVVVEDHSDTAHAKIRIIRPDGAVSTAVLSHAPAPVAEGELFATVEQMDPRAVYWAIDTVAGRAHPVSVPEGAQNVVQTDSGQLRTVSEAGTYAWSDDGGNEWREVPGAKDRLLRLVSADSAPDTHVLVGGRVGPTQFGVIRVLQEGGSWSVFPQWDDPVAYVGPTAVLPDGRFLARVQIWSDNSPSEPLIGTPPGMYVSVGDDWSAYERVETGAPFDVPQLNQPLVMDLELTTSGVRLTAIGPDGKAVWTSDDLGATWQEMRAR